MVQFDAIAAVQIVGLETVELRPVNENFASPTWFISFNGSRTRFRRAVILEIRNTVSASWYQIESPASAFGGANSAGGGNALVAALAGTDRACAAVAGMNQRFAVRTRITSPPIGGLALPHELVFGIQRGQPETGDLSLLRAHRNHVAHLERSLGVILVGGLVFAGEKIGIRSRSGLPLT